ncbi:DNA-3-methyladenine glycosylase 2 family protein [Flavobacterium sp. TP390]|uniref:DNA-3-methyladenine glycosylase II n=1 Tax=Flavobacterium profundi TaxID=1774945 RepID=A0A6I4IH89_9FLAO|nr:DNA-3-methyladenine glycosylase [Flavobacterium profundi]MVO09053.1 DNA-3-methyladenine glycosylase 2 family protein [Flavobacterium profundi]
MKKDIPFLLQKDAVFQEILNLYGEPYIGARPEGFVSLCKLIIEQQVSLASAKACFVKLESFLGTVTPTTILKASEIDLRNNGLSKQKANYLKALATAVVEKTLDLETLSQKEEAQIKKELTAVKGIGNWTAEVYMMFCLQKENVFPIGDIALQNTLKELYPVTTKEEMLSLAKKWEPQASLATYFFWHYYLKKRNRAPLVY